jgi:hypothetical protein
MSENLIVPTMAEMLAKENNLKYYFGWVVQVVLMIKQKKLTTFVILNRATFPLQYSVPKRVAQVIRQKSRK